MERLVMVTAIAGGGGQIGRRLCRLLAAQGDVARPLVRRVEQADELRGRSVEPVLCDLETADVGELAAAIAGGDAVVFAAGAGPGSGPERKETVDHLAAVRLIEAAAAAGIARYLMVSSTGADPNAPGDETFAVYLRAKGRADAALAASELDYTIVRPGPLTDAPGTGLVAVGGHVERAEIPRDDVAAVLAAALTVPETVGATFELMAGETPIAEALAALG